MEEHENGLPVPAIACEGCRHAVEQTRSLSRGREVWWYCRLMFGWMWAGDPEEGYPEECSAWEAREQESEE